MDVAVVGLFDFWESSRLIGTCTEIVTENKSRKVGDRVYT
jgi:hypothetical protein